MKVGGEQDRSPDAKNFNIRSAPFGSHTRSASGEGGAIATPAQIKNAIINGQRPKIPAKVPKSHANIITRCWAHAPQDRVTMEEIVTEISAWRCKCELCAFVVNPRQSARRRPRVRKGGLTERSKNNGSVTFASQSETSFAAEARSWVTESLRAKGKSRASTGNSLRVPETSRRTVSATGSRRREPKQRKHGRKSHLAVLQL